MNQKANSRRNAAAFTTRNGRGVDSAKKSRFSLTNNSALTHSEYAAIKASADFKFRLTYLAYKAIGTRSSFSVTHPKSFLENLIPGFFNLHQNLFPAQALKPASVFSLVGPRRQHGLFCAFRVHMPAPHADSRISTGNCSHARSIRNRNGRVKKAAAGMPPYPESGSLGRMEASQPPEGI